MQKSIEKIKDAEASAEKIIDDAKMNAKSILDKADNDVNELKKSNKPFIIVLNSSNPYGSETEMLREELENKYEVPVKTINCSQLKDEDINLVLESLLYEFPVSVISINIPFHFVIL